MIDVSMAGNQNIRHNLSIALDAYEDILYQVYTNDEIIALAKAIDANQTQALSRNQLRRILQSLCYVKDGIESIMVVTAGGHAVYYDKLTASSVTSSWLNKDGLTLEEISVQDNATELLPSQFAYTVGGRQNYLFHMKHRLIDYQSVNLDVGAAVLSINEDVLREICGERSAASFHFIVDANGRLITYPIQSRIGGIVDDASYQSFKSLFLSDSFWTEHSELFFSETVRGWRVVSAVDLSPFEQQARQQLIGDLLIGLTVMAISILIIVAVTSLLYQSLNKVAEAMRRAQSGDLTVSVAEKRVFTKEMTVIASAFNLMITRLNHLVEEIRIETRNRKDAEIKALEAQLNPHFLYNVLDGINWLSIDNGQYEISNMISALAKILRYSISNSNAIVPLRTELAWLRQYVDLQSARFRERFELELETADWLMDIPIRKLLLQPFIENAIVHGFKNGSDGPKRLKVSVQEDDGILIRIMDNGKGIAAEKLQEIIDAVDQADDHIGIPNAIGRIRLYYGEGVTFHIQSEPGVGTEVNIKLHIKELIQ